MKTISLKDLKKECIQIAKAELPYLNQSVYVYELKSCNQIMSFFMVLGDYHEQKYSREPVKLLTHLQIKKADSGSCYVSERFVIDMTKQYSETSGYRTIIESTILQLVRDYISSQGNKSFAELPV